MGRARELVRWGGRDVRRRDWPDLCARFGENRAACSRLRDSDTRTAEDAVFRERRCEAEERLDQADGVIAAIGQRTSGDANLFFDGEFIRMLQRDPCDLTAIARLSGELEFGRQSLRNRKYRLDGAINGPAARLDHDAFALFDIEQIGFRDKCKDKALAGKDPGKPVFPRNKNFAFVGHGAADISRDRRAKDAVFVNV